MCKKKIFAILCALFIGSASMSVQAAFSQQNVNDANKNTEDSSKVIAYNEEETTKKKLYIAPSGISKDSSGSMYIADRTYHVLRKRTKKGTYMVLAGQAGKSGYQDGDAKKALFDSPWDTVLYKNGWAISDTENHVIRFYYKGKVTTIAGSGKSGYKNGVGKKAQLNRPTGMAVGTNGEIYVSDTGNHLIRKIDKTGKVTLYAGTKKGCKDGTLKSASFNEPTGLYFYKGALYVADSGNHRICKIEGGKVTTVAGSEKGIEGDLDGSATKSRFSNPQDIILYKGMIYVSDTGNDSIKKVYKGKVTTVVKAFSLQENMAPAEPSGMTIQDSYLYVGDMFLEKFLKIKI